MNNLEDSADALNKKLKLTKADAKRMKQQLQMEAEQHRKLMALSNDAILLFKEGICIECNVLAQEIFKCEPSSLLGKSIAELSAEHQPDGSYSLLKFAKKAEELTHQDPIRFEWQFLTPNGTRLEALVTLSQYHFADHTGNIIIIRDISRQKETERALQASSEHINMLATHAPVYMKLSDAKDKFYYFGKQWLQFTGRTKEQEQNDWQQSIHPGDLKQIQLELDKRMASRKAFELVYRLRHKDGTYHWLLDKAVPQHDTFGFFKGYIFCAVDITERKKEDETIRRHETLRNSELQLQIALENVSLMAVTINDQGIIRYSNHYFTKITGWTNEEVLGKNLFELAYPNEDPQQKRNEFREFLRTGGYLTSFERKIFTKKGESRTIKFNAVILNSVQDGTSGTTLVGEDITDKLRVANELKRSTSQLQDFIENANDLIQVFSLEGKLLFVNNAWKKTLGYTDEEIKDLTIEDIIHPDNLESTLLNLEYILKGENLDKFETAFITKNNRKIHLKASINCRYSRGKPVAFRGIMYDITDQVRAERAQKLYYSIASIATQSTNLKDLYDNIHHELSQVIDTRNFYISLTNNDKYINFVYYLDENYGENVNTGRRKVAKGLTEYAMHLGHPVILYDEDIRKLSEESIIEIFGPLPKIWLGVPLRLNQKITGVIAIQSYRNREAYDQKDLELLDFISGQIALSIQRKQDEEKINNQTARLNAIFESSTHLMWSVNRKITLTSFNQNYGNDVQTYFNVLPKLKDENTSPRLKYGGQEYLDFWNEKYEMAFKGIPQHFEMCLPTKNGGQVWREIFLNPIYLQDGQIEEVSGIANDITQKKRNEIALQKSEEKFRNIFESFQDIYFRTDSEGVITMISPSVQELCGYKPEEVLGKKITEFYLYNIKRKQSLKGLWRRGSIRNFEVPIVAKDGSVINFICNIRLIYDFKNNKRTIETIEGVARDITELKKASEEVLKSKEIAERSLKVKEQFLANMSHEIRTPMNGIIGVIDLISDTSLDKEQQEYVQTIKKSSETLLNILNDILDISKIEAGKMQLRLSTISLEQTIEKLFSLFQQQANAKDLELNLSIDEGVPAYVKADETRLIQILSNLTSNAIKFTDQGSVTVHISAKEQRNRKHLIRVEVTDTGIGISKDNLALLFDNFSQVDTSSTKSYAGTGLGLVISKELSKMMNGDIGVNSKPGKGSTFWFTFEAKESKTPPPSKKQNELTEQPIYRFEKITPYLLVVDDNQVNRKVAREILLKSGCVVDTASDGAEAIEKVREHNYHLVLMDIQMPGMDGITATRHIKELDKKLPPIVAMTAYSMQGDDVKFMEAGMDDYISKPITSKNLVGKVKEWVEKAKPGSTKRDNSRKVKAEPVAPAPKIANAPKTADLPIINMKAAEQLKRIIGNSMTLETFQDFETESLELIENSQNSVNNKDYNVILSNLHTLKGNAGTLGISRVEAYAKSIEADLKAGNDSTLQEDLSKLRDSYEEFKLNYHSLLNLNE